MLIFGIASLSALVLCGCANGVPGQPLPSEVPIVPSEISDFNILYAQNCSGCHGRMEKVELPSLLPIPCTSRLQTTRFCGARRRMEFAGTAMPAFAQSAGGMLTDKQIDRDRRRNS